MSLKPTTVVLVSICTLFCASAWSQPAAQAGQAVKHGAQASGNASASAAHSIVASGQVTSAAVAVPLMASGAVTGSVAGASVAVGQDSMRAAAVPIGTPLEVTDEAITVVSPKEALKPKGTNL